MCKQPSSPDFPTEWRRSTSRLQYYCRWLCCLVTIAICCSSVRISTSQDTGTSLINREYPLKAIFLYHIVGYIEWPAGTFPNETTPFVIGTYGSSAIDETLKTIANSKKLGERSLEFRKFSTIKEIRGCQILFVSRDVSASQHKEILVALKNEPVLVVGETQGFAAQGASTNFFIEANKIRFEVNTAVTKRLGLKVSSKLLSMAKIVPDETAKR